MKLVPLKPSPRQPPKPFRAEVKADLKADIGGARTEIAALEAKVWRAGVTIAALAVLLNKFLDWVIR